MLDIEELKAANIEAYQAVDRLRNLLGKFCTERQLTRNTNGEPLVVKALSVSDVMKMTSFLVRANTKPKPVLPKDLIEEAATWK